MANRGDEIVVVSVGHGANYVASHFWNFCQLNVVDAAKDPTRAAPPAAYFLFHQTSRNTHEPRAVFFDGRAYFPAQNGAAEDAPSPSDVSWNGRIQRHDQSSKTVATTEASQRLVRKYRDAYLRRPLPPAASKGSASGTKRPLRGKGRARRRGAADPTDPQAARTALEDAAFRLFAGGAGKGESKGEDSEEDYSDDDGYDGYDGYGEYDADDGQNGYDGYDGHDGYGGRAAADPSLERHPFDRYFAAQSGGGGSPAADAASSSSEEDAAEEEPLGGGDVASWGDLLLPQFHGRSMQKMSIWDVRESFSRFSQGADMPSDAFEEHYDAVRHQLERCDHPQSCIVACDAYGGWAALASRLCEALRDDLSKSSPLVALPVFAGAPPRLWPPPRGAAASGSGRARRLAVAAIGEGLLLSKLGEEAAAVVPVGANCGSPYGRGEAQRWSAAPALALCGMAVAAGDRSFSAQSPALGAVRLQPNLRNVCFAAVSNAFGRKFLSLSTRTPAESVLAAQAEAAAAPAEGRRAAAPAMLRRMALLQPHARSLVRNWSTEAPAYSAASGFFSHNVYCSGAEAVLPQVRSLCEGARCLTGAAGGLMVPTEALLVPPTAPAGLWAQGRRNPRRRMRLSRDVSAVTHLGATTEMHGFLGAAAQHFAAATGVEAGGDASLATQRLAASPAALSLEGLHRDDCESAAEMLRDAADAYEAP